MSSYAIVIGVNHYPPPDKKGLKPLEGAINDANAIAGWLRTNAGVPAENIKLLTSEEGLGTVLKDQVDQAIADIQDEVMELPDYGDRLYFYFAGHGMGTHQNKQDIGLCLSNWTETLLNVSAMSSQSYKSKFESEGYFKELVIWLDCCRYTKHLLMPAPSAGVNSTGPHETKYFLSFATTHDNPAHEYSVGTGAFVEKRGIFTKVLLEGLNGAAAKEGIVNSASLADYLYFEVQKQAQEAGFSQKADSHHNTTSYTQIIFP